MSTDEIALFTIIVFLFIIAIYQFVLLRRSHEKKQHQEQKNIEYKDIVDITPEFKFETQTNNVDIHQIKDLMKPVTDIVIAEPDAETISIEEKIRRQKRDLKTFPDPDNKIHDIKNDTQEGIDEIPKTKPGITESHAAEDINVTVAMMEDVSGLKLEDTLIGIEEGKKRRKKIATKKSDSTIKKSIVSSVKPSVGEKEIKKIKPKKKSLKKEEKEEEKVIQKEAPGEDEKPVK
ncbi:hypothetical protein METP2_01637 [Methanosarcinales archaeon]|nr:hypothetical protein [Candidatus Methanoperedens sp. BLZ2]KAB2944772.1 MAG: hypothetical protein F9K14_13065 [Candidatus Methanoperedens sp.]MBZ0177061.1 hypothetical protein [Candidatus Methanoperedens nitroreducens]CAG0975326.1 hypothetical protein METP2_01637 [Methanosarcinales archaeon]MCX9077492.1 hypothetical protein [Candidatus Methanoperedens sp.]MCX9087031.1 hypothetical protein [Candidatus Methanoperedens sp.]